MTRSETITVIIVIACAFYNQFFGEHEYRPQWGDSCGYGYHYINASIDAYGSELTCAED
jgi:hypothetical protein